MPGWENVIVLLCLKISNFFLFIYIFTISRLVGSVWFVNIEEKKFCQNLEPLALPKSRAKNMHFSLTIATCNVLLSYNSKHWPPLTIGNKYLALSGNKIFIKFNGKFKVLLGNFFFFQKIDLSMNFDRNSNDRVELENIY